jgi:hypothetical protein
MSFVKKWKASVGAPSGAITYGAPLILIAAEAAPTASDVKSDAISWLKCAPQSGEYLIIMAVLPKERVVIRTVDH